MARAPSRFSLKIKKRVFVKALLGDGIKIMKRDVFESLVIEAMSTLPIRVRKAIKNVAIVIEQEPRRKKMSEVSIKRDEMLLGLYEGIPLTQRGSGYFGVLPDKITIFQKSIEALSRESEEEVATLVCEVVWHEIGHYFGLSDAELDILEKKKKNPALPISREK